MAKVSAVGHQHTGGNGPKIPLMNFRQFRSGQLPANRDPPKVRKKRPANARPLQTPATVPAIANLGGQEHGGLPGRQIMIVDDRGSQ